VSAPHRSRKPLKLAVLLQDLYFGGTQRYAIHLLRGLNRSLFAPELWVLNNGDDLEAEARTTAAPLVRISRRPPGSPLALPLLARQILRARPDILYTLTVVPNIWGRLFGRMADIPAIIAGFRALAPAQWESLLWRCSDRLICNAEILRQHAVNHHKVPADRVAVVPNCVDTERFRPAEGAQGGPPRIVSVARLVPDKSPLVLLEAFALVRRQIPEARLTLVGEGPLLPQVLACMSERNLRDAVDLVSGCGDVRPHLAQAQIFALASHREGSPNAILEAMASGLPVVAARTGGIPELVDHDQTGLLVEPKNAADFARALVRLLQHNSLCTAMGAAGRDKAMRHHAPDVMVRATERELLRAWTRRNPTDGGGV
jgi:glycosyltransferase involved in cell wall biosynthesis